MKITSGLVSSDKIKIIHHLIPKSNTTARPQWFMSPKWVTVHNTGNVGASARNNSIYVDRNTDYVSWHFTVGNGEVYQELPINEVAFHAGDGSKGTGNRQSIGIEIAEVDGAEETAILFIAELLGALNIDISKVVPHKHWSGKNCPRLILPHWDLFISKIEGGGILTVDEAKIIVKEKAKLDDITIQYIARDYRYGDDLIIKLAKAMK